MKNIKDLKSIANKLRRELIIIHSKAHMSHISSDLSCLDILITLYFNILKKGDHFILSKGHAALALYSVLHEKSIVSNSVYSSLGNNGSLLAEHPLYGMPGIEIATGSLGHGLSVGAGMALTQKLNKSKGKVYILLSDGECQEGSTLEAMNFCARMGLNNLIAIVDNNGWQAFDQILISIKRIKREFISAGWEVIEINGHDYNQIYNALKTNSNKPKLIIAHTILGKGVKSMENNLGWHYWSPKSEDIEKFLEEVIK